MDGARGVVAVTNRQAFADISGFELFWRLDSDGRRMQGGVLATGAVPAGSRADVEVPFDRSALRPYEEHLLTVTTRLARDAAWAPAGHEVARDQMPIGPAGRPTPRPTLSAGEPVDATWRVDDDTALLVLKQGGSTLTFLTMQMSYHHIAQGELAGEPWMVSF